MDFKAVSNRRLRKELRSFAEVPIQGVFIDADQIRRDIRSWIINIEGPEGSLYAGERFELKFNFDTHGCYPLDPPEVKFVGQIIPVHPQVFDDGSIFLSILTSDKWTPTTNVRLICVTIMSTLSSCKKKERPNIDYLQDMVRSSEDTN